MNTTNLQTDIFSAATNQQIHQAFCDWFEENQRPLPWRRDYNPYHIWISEIMLQQTRMETVLDYFQRWMKRYPTIEELAEASEEELLKLWEGLGYYSRVRNIHKAAKIIASDLNGKIPTNRKDLEALPGIGSYTAGAITSIAFQQQEALVDGNVQRVFSRLFDWGEDIQKSISKRFFMDKGEELLAYGEARTFNQSLMELGALVCPPQSPKCSNCPIQTFCLAKQAGTITSRPVKLKKPKITKVNMILPVLCHDERYYLEQQDEKALWANMWSFPFFEQEKSKGTEEEQVDRFLTKRYGPLKNGESRRLASFAHSVTRYRIQAQPILIPLKSLPAKGTLPGKWFTFRELELMSLPKSGVMIRRQLEEE